MTQTPKQLFLSRPFLMALLFNAVWINASEIFRYFVFVRPMMRELFPPELNVADMNLTIFAIWGVWDTILVCVVTLFAWLYLERFDKTTRNAIAAGTIIWSGIFVILWLGLYNMNLASPAIMAIALLLSWFELVIAALIVLKITKSV